MLSPTPQPCAPAAKPHSGNRCGVPSGFCVMRNVPRCSRVESLAGWQVVVDCLSLLQARAQALSLLHSMESATLDEEEGQSSSHFL